MPNWCNNYLRVKGDKEELKKFKDFAIEKSEDKSNVNLLDFENFKPYPKQFTEMDKQESNKSFNLDKEKDKCLLVDGLDGYMWCVKFWGTKWNSCEANLILDVDNGDNELYYSFDTAWSPPTPIIETMSKKFPKLTFELDYEEAGCDFMGSHYCQDGEVIFEENKHYEACCDECNVRGEEHEVEYDDDNGYLCKRCRYTELQKILDKKIEQETTKLNNDNKK